MGLFDAIKKAVSQVSTSAVSSAKAMQDAQGYNGNTGSSKFGNTANSSTELAPGVRNYDIVGESFRPDSFERLQTEFEKEDGDTVEVEVTVKIDPNNPHAKNGKAVGVYISEQLVGYIPNLDAEKMFDFLKKRKGIGTCQGTVYFDSSSEKPMNSVQLHMQWPPIYLDEATQNVPYTRPTGTTKHEVSASEPQLANGIAEVDVDVTGRSKDNLDYEVNELLKLKDGNTAFVIGAVCLFRGQKSDNVFVQAGDTVGGVKGAAKAKMARADDPRKASDG